MKTQIHAELVSLLAQELEVAEAAHKATVEGATHPEAKPENDKDTRALELQYLARGQAARVEELRREWLEASQSIPRTYSSSDRAAMWALVTAESEGKSTTYYLAAGGGGAKLGQGRIQVLTRQSPLGRAFIGAKVGDEIVVELGGKEREYLVRSIS